ncbi:MAG TPA: hypothetical protein VM840_00310 [Actinomycetota bacterium]|nr:hypothetical protein [Actinomycetota bacterium]
MSEFRVAHRTDASTGYTVYQLWERRGEGAEEVLHGEFETRDAAEAAMNRSLFHPEREPRAGLGTTDTEPVILDDEYPEV